MLVVRRATQAFQLHDTYGFPIDLTLEMAAEQGLSVDEQGFRALMAEQRAKGKADAKQKKTGGVDTSAYRGVLEETGVPQFTGYGEVRSDKPALLLIHGQMGAWEDYANLLPELSENWHVYAVDVYGHGQSSHDPSLYYLDVNGDDLIWFIDHVIGQKTVVCGHSNGALTAGYIGAYGGKNVAGVVLEDPPVFSTEGEDWENTFAYLDTYRNVHAYNQSDKSECWPAFYLRRCYWGQLYMAKSMPGIANYAQHYQDKHPGEEVKIFFLPSSVTGIFHYVVDYDFQYG